ncbi:MAG TPA: glycosyltransferase family 39 protein [Acidobacteriota bacterium]|nr:glycosyltransferase family 39 protein [Acidobacteriota bacterium]
MKRTLRIVVLWILVAILFPAVLSHILYKRTHLKRGVSVNAMGGYWIDPNFNEAFKDLWQKKYNSLIDVKSFLWIPESGTHFAAIKGPPRRLFLDGKPLKDLSGKPWCLTNEPLHSGLHSVVIRVPRIPPESVPIDFFITRSLRVREPFSKDSLFIDPPTDDDLTSIGIAKFLGIGARFNCLMMFVILVLIVIYKHLSPILRKPSILFLCLFAVMIFLRFYGLSYLMEEGLHPDERVVENTASFFRAGQLKPQSYLYTPGFHYMTAALENLGAWVFVKDLPPHFVPRFLSALFSSLSCLLVLSIAATILPEICALIASILFGFSFLSIQLAHWGIIEPTMVFFFLLGIRFIVKLKPDSTLKDYLKAGLACGAAVGIKQTAGVIVVPFLLMFFYLHRKSFFRIPAIKRMLSYGAGAVAAYITLSPFTVFDFTNFVRAQLFQFRFLSGETHTALYFVDDPSGASKILEYLEEGIGYPILIAAVAGAFLIWRRSKVGFLVIVPFTMLFFILSVLAHAAPYHYPLLLYPFFAILAAVTVYDIVSAASKASGVRNALIVLLVAGLLIPPIKRTITLQRILASKDTRQQFSEWAYRNLPLGSRIDTELFGPRLLIPVFRSLLIPLWTRGTWEQYMAIRIPEYVVMDSATANIFLRKEREIFPDEHEWFASLRKNGIKIKEFKGITFGQYNPHILVYKIPKD